MPVLTYTTFRQELLKKSTRRLPLDTYIELTYRCNFRCLQCYNPVNRCSGIEMSTSELIHFIDLLTEAGCLWLSFTGGEPFIRKDFFELYTYAMKKGLLCCIQSNGALISEEIASKLADNPPCSMDITVYGASSQTYEVVTGSAEGFDACLEGIDNLLRVRIKPLLKTTIIKQNKDDICAIKALADARGLEYMYSPHIHSRIDKDNSPHALRVSTKEATLLVLAEERHHKGWKEYLELHLNEPHSQKMLICGGLEDGLWINPYGVLRLCGIVLKPTYDLRHGGTIEEAQDFFSNYIKIKAQEKPREDNPCFKCRLFSFCDQCVGWSELEHSDWNRKVDYLCEIAHLQEGELKRLGIWPKEVKDYV